MLNHLGKNCKMIDAMRYNASTSVTNVIVLDFLLAGTIYV